MHFVCLLILLLASPITPQEPKTQRGIPYAEPNNERQMLDVYAPPEGNNHPVVLWIHGGGWKAGDKKAVQAKPQAFVDKGYVFVSTNYRFVPQVTVKEMTGDVAKAIRWIHEHAQEYGGDPKRIFVMGHSAGAHLAALVCTDERYLKAEGLSLSIIKGSVPVDTAVYDVKKQVGSIGPARTAMYVGVFGKTEMSQKDFSPVTYVAKGKSIPPFLILHVADRPDSKAQSHLFADKLQEAGIPVTVFAAEGTNHGTINANLGKAGDKPTQEMWVFMGKVLQPRNIDYFKSKLDKTLTPAKAEEIFGKPDRNIGSGLIIYEYGLDDGTKVLLGFPGFDRILYAKHIGKDGKAVDLPLR